MRIQSEILCLRLEEYAHFFFQISKDSDVLNIDLTNKLRYDRHESKEVFFEFQLHSCDVVSQLPVGLMSRSIQCSLHAIALVRRIICFSLCMTRTP